MNENLYSNFRAPIWIFNGNHLHEPLDFDFIRYLTQYNQYGGGYLNREKLDMDSSDLLRMIEASQIKYMKFVANKIIKIFIFTPTVFLLAYFF